MGAFRVKIEAIIKQAVEAWADKQITLRELYGLVGEIMRAVIMFMDEMENPEDYKEELIEDCEGLYDEYIAPIDIEWIPNWIEPVFDKLFKSMVRAGIEAAYDVWKAREEMDDA